MPANSFDGGRMNASHMKSRRGDPSITVWSGGYQCGRDHSYVTQVEKVAKTYGNPEDRPAETDFREELERLRSIARRRSHVLLGQLDYRWRNPDCSNSLYVLTVRLRAPNGGYLIAGGGKMVQDDELVEGAALVRELRCTKVGETSFSIAARMTEYLRKDAKIDKVPIVPGTQNLRVVIYGDRPPAMLMQRDVLKVASSYGGQAWWVDEAGKLRTVGDETYVGVKIVNHICAFAREHERQVRNTRTRS